MVTKEQVTLVQNSFAAIAPIADDAAALFYRRLFELDPRLQAMFKGDMTEQRKKRMHMLTLAVKGLNRLDQLVPVVEDPGRRHVGYGVEDRHYETVGEALLWTLEKGLGPAFTPETTCHVGKGLEAGHYGDCRADAARRRRAHSDGRRAVGG